MKGLSGPDKYQSIIVEIFGRFRNRSLARLSFLMECVARGMPLTIEAIMKRGNMSRRSAYEYKKTIEIARFFFGEF